MHIYLLSSGSKKIKEELLKKLEEMSLEELWQLFPIILKEHCPQYASWYENEKQSLLSIVPAQDIIRLNHIGSTAVAGLLAKPIIDILMEVSITCHINALSQILKSNKWLLTSSIETPKSLTFNKGYTVRGFARKVFHLHVRHAGEWDELYFRDYLIAHPETANEYAKLKLSLLDSFKHDRDGYTKAKTEFVQKYSQIAKQELAGKYAFK
jgi:GrpB-like predicted nucleotidyltransferase (UPF0157 family)